MEFTEVDPIRKVDTNLTKGKKAGEVTSTPALLTLRLLTLPGINARLGLERVFTIAGICRKAEDEQRDDE
jgi:hypothetical protein